MITFPCPYGGEDHSYPDDWVFGGADGKDPRADPRFMPTHYQYIDAEYGFCYLTGSYLCDDEALDNFTLVAQDSDPKFIAAKRPGDNKYRLMPFVYVAETDTVHPHASGVDST